VLFLGEPKVLRCFTEWVAPDVRYGSKGDVGAALGHVRFAPQAGSRFHELTLPITPAFAGRTSLSEPILMV